MRTVALWLTSPPKHQPRGEMRVDDITVKVTTVLLHEEKASALLASPKTACFAAGAQAEGRTTEALCAEVAAALRAHNATWAERHMAVVAAAMRGRYKEMVSAMEQVNLEPVMIEDLVKFGEDRGKRRGLKEGIKKGRAEGRQEGRAEGRQEGRAEGRLVEKRAALRRVLELRKLALSPEHDHQIDTCTDLAALDRWLDQAIFAASAAEALE